MKQDKYYIKILPEFLFDIYNVYSSVYTPWVYLYLKLKYNYYLDNAPHKMYNIDVQNISETFSTSPATVYESLKELELTGLVEKNKRKYRILSERGYLNKYRKAEIDNNKKLPEYMYIFKNYFDDLLSGIKKQIVPSGKYIRCIIKCLRIYFYLTASNKHCMLRNPVMESELSQSILERELKHDHRIIKPLLSLLENAGYLQLSDGKIYTIDKRIYDPESHRVTRHFQSVTVPEKPDLTDGIQNNTKTVPKSFIGYRKFRDGKWISALYYNKKKEITMALWCKGDGVPATEEEIMIGDDLLSKGKNSIYYDPEKYWLYKPENEKNSDAA